MIPVSIAERTWIGTRCTAWLTLTLALPLCTLAAPAPLEVPTLQQGQWEFKRSVTSGTQKQPAVQSIQKCLDPTDDIRSKWDALSRQTCKFSPVKHSGNRYQYSAICNKNGASTRMMSIITVQGPSAYDVVTQSVNGERRATESLSAHRIGDCTLPPTAAPAPLPPTR